MLTIERDEWDRLFDLPYERLAAELRMNQSEAIIRKARRVMW